MATKIANVKSVKQPSVDLLFSVRDYALKCGYSDSVAMKIAVVALDRKRQTGESGLWQAIVPIRNRTATGGKQTVKTFLRLTKGKSLVSAIPIEQYLLPQE